MRLQFRVKSVLEFQPYSECDVYMCTGIGIFLYTWLLLSENGDGVWKDCSFSGPRNPQLEYNSHSRSDVKAELYTHRAMLLN
ncbi:hypothetical protein PDJAM_G00124550 [Pangasius djambal]|uniref:Uncharacterized protein n=1 Tax=Pangasius djambal TaxID=1691987 RepID=A0ACC5ZAQ5_9TELE|nr:hypothetical protein [Pangasius djambal]